MGIPLREILEEPAGGMLPGSELKAFMPGGASTGFMPAKTTTWTWISNP